MRFLTLAFLILFVGVSISVTAQEELSKEDKKRWTNKAKEYRKDPAALKKLTEDKVAYQQEALQSKSELANLESQLNQQREQLAMAQQQNAQLTSQLSAANQTISDLNNQIDQMASMPPASMPETSAPSGDNYNMGVLYRVQVGAYKAVPAKYDGLPDVTVEDVGNIKKVLLGNYRNYDEAVSRMRSLKSQGYKSPWVVAFRDGQRVSLKEARGY